MNNESKMKWKHKKNTHTYIHTEKKTLYIFDEWYNGGR